MGEHHPKPSAAGLPGITHGLSAAFKQMGVPGSARTLLKVNQVDGFDCPGCAWPEPGKRSHFEFCENGAKAVAEEATLRRVAPDFFAQHSLTGLAAQTDYWLGKQGRLTSPMVKRPGVDHYRPIAWEEAFTLIAAQLKAIKPNQAVFYTSGRTSNEAAFLYQLFARAYGTNNLPDCSNMCHESSGVALTQAIGVGKGTVTLEDVHRARLIAVVGQNPGTNHPRMLIALEEAKRRGARIISVNPLPEAGLMRFKNPKRVNGIVGRGTVLSDLHLPIRIGGDLALFQAIGAHLRDWDALDHAFIERYTSGFEAYAQNRPDPRRVAEATGLSEAEIEAAARMFAESDATIVCWAMGLTQARDAVATIQEIVNVQLLRGMIGKPGAGLCPVRGHSNVQGDRTMGICHEPPAWAARLPVPVPRKKGLDTVESIRAMRDREVRVFVGLGGNFAAATPDTEVTGAALAGCAMTVHIATKLNRSHVIAGPEQTSLILPCLGRTERDPGGAVTVEDSMSNVHLSRGRLEPASAELRSEVAIIAGLARATLHEMWATDYPAIRAQIAEVVPGFDDFEARVRGNGFTIAQGPRDSRTFPTLDGKARFTTSPLSTMEVQPGRLILQTVRSHDQYNTTIYGLDDRYRGVRGERRVVFVNPQDLAELGIADNSKVDIVSEFQQQERRAKAFRVISYPTARGCAATYFPEANVLVPLDSTAHGSNTPTSKQIIVRLEPA
jgi:molybdopterin-dependent oxidoreductase alpha subunit